tara:strand:+ start:499 stop:888 length:390 start_codon:yes stop_codon:yes gene_type:complete
LVVRSSLATCLHAVAVVNVIEVYLGLKRNDLSIFRDGKAPIDEVIGTPIDLAYLELFAFALILNITDSSHMLGMILLIFRLLGMSFVFYFIGYRLLVEVLCVSLLELLLWFFRAEEAGSPHLREGAVGQ